MRKTVAVGEMTVLVLQPVAFGLLHTHPKRDGRELIHLGSLVCFPLPCLQPSQSRLCCSGHVLIDLSNLYVYYE